MFSEAKALHDTIKAQTGALVGIACKQGRFAVTCTIRNGRRYTTEHLTAWQDYAACLVHMRKLARA